MNLSKPFDSLQYNLLLAKINAYGFDYKPLKLIPSYLNNRKYRTKINSSFSEWKHLFIDLSFLFMSEANVASYIDDTTIYACEKKSTWCAKKVRI